MLPITEADFQARVMQTAHLTGWMVAHFRPAMTQRGRWVTPMSGDTGFPDLVLARDGRVIVAELKRDKGIVSTGQMRWLSALGDYGRVWRPRDWPEILAELSSRRTV